MNHSFTRSLAPIVFAVLNLSHAHAACLPDGVQSSGAAYRICMPDGAWNGNLVIYAHGYVDITQPLGIPENQLVLPDGTSIPGIINGLGYAFAASGYSVNGLAVLQGIADSADLVNVFSAAVGPPKKVFITGPSEGGLITALSIEQKPNLYDGAFAICGPIGDFPAQINYIGDFRIVFDYFFPGIIPGSAVHIPQSVMDNWNSVYLPAINAAIAANPSATSQLLKVTNAAIGSDPSTIQETVDALLWYSAFTTNDAVAKLGGQPFDNSNRLYHGSNNDLLLNLLVRRFSADPAAINQMKKHYNASGFLTRPLITMHTLGDPIIPAWHEPLYTLKTIAAGAASQHIYYPIQAYGHCNVTADQAEIGFLTLVIKAGDPVPTSAQQVLPAP